MADMQYFHWLTDRYVEACYDRRIAQDCGDAVAADAAYGRMLHYERLMLEGGTYTADHAGDERRIEPGLRDGLRLIERGER